MSDMNSSTSPLPYGAVDANGLQVIGNGQTQALNPMAKAVVGGESVHFYVPDSQAANVLVQLDASGSHFDTDFVVGGDYGKLLTHINDDALVIVTKAGATVTISGADVVDADGGAGIYLADAAQAAKFDLFDVLVRGGDVVNHLSDGQALVNSFAAMSVSDGFGKLEALNGRVLAQSLYAHVRDGGPTLAELNFWTDYRDTHSAGQTFNAFIAAASQNGEGKADIGDWAFAQDRDYQYHSDIPLPPHHDPVPVVGYEAPLYV